MNYARTTKVVDIRALKQTIWKDLEEENETVEQKHSFHEIISQFPEQNPAGRLEDISVPGVYLRVAFGERAHGLVIKSVRNERFGDLKCAYRGIIIRKYLNLCVCACVFVSKYILLPL